VEALRIIDPSIAAVSMVGGDRPRGPRTAIVRSNKIPRPVPLRSFGDRLNRLFGIALSLVNAKDGLLLIDEFENGMHYSVQLDTWRMIFRLAAVAESLAGSMSRQLAIRRGGMQPSMAFPALRLPPSYSELCSI